MPHIQTQDDGRFREAIADLICRDWLLNPNQRTASDFTAWAKQHKKLLIGLFGGQGVQRLSRTVAWARREVSGRREPPELLCHLSDLHSAGNMDVTEPVLHQAWPDQAAMLQSVLLDDLVAKVLFRPLADTPMTEVRTVLFVLLGL